jgi:hypothetical protein
VTEEEELLQQRSPSTIRIHSKMHGSRCIPVKEKLLTFSSDRFHHRAIFTLVIQLDRNDIEADRVQRAGCAIPYRDPGGSEVINKLECPVTGALQIFRPPVLLAC